MSQEGKGLTKVTQLVKDKARPQAHVPLEEPEILRQWRSCGGREESSPMGKGGQGLACSVPILRASVCLLPWTLCRTQWPWTLAPGALAERYSWGFLSIR